MPLVLHTGADRERERQGNQLFSSSSFTCVLAHGPAAVPVVKGMKRAPLQAVLGKCCSLSQLPQLYCSCQHQHRQELHCIPLQLSNTIHGVFEVPRCNPTASSGIIPPIWMIFPLTSFLSQQMTVNTEREYCPLFILIILNLSSIEVISPWVTCWLDADPLG